MAHEVQGSISPNHPALAGHFPGNPVVPGVVILTALLQATEEQLHWTRGPVSVSSVKFMRLLRPGEPFTLLLEPRSDCEVSFAVMREQVRIATGTLRRTGPVMDQDRS